MKKIIKTLISNISANWITELQFVFEASIHILEVFDVMMKALNILLKACIHILMAFDILLKAYIHILKTLNIPSHFTQKVYDAWAFLISIYELVSVRTISNLFFSQN